MPYWPRYSVAGHGTGDFSPEKTTKLRHQQIRATLRVAFAIHSTFFGTASELEQLVYPFGEPDAQASRRLGIVDPSGGEGATECLPLSQGMTEILGDLRTRLQNRGKVRFREFIDGGRSECTNARTAGGSRQQANLSEVISRSKTQYLRLAAAILVLSDRKDATTNNKKRLQQSPSFDRCFAGGACQRF
jgi:hypothetical protein